MDTQKRLDYIEQLLREGIVFEIYHLAQNEDTVYGVTTYKYNERYRALYPYTRYPDGCGGGGSYTTLKEASEQILLLVRDNHDTLIEEIWTYINDKVPEASRQGYVVTIKWIHDVEKINMWSGTIFCDDPETMLKINEELHQKRLDLKPHKKQLYEQLKSEIQKYQTWRKNNNQWDLIRG